MRSLIFLLAGLALVAAACTSAEQADTESLSVPEPTDSAVVDSTLSPATTPELVTGDASVTASTYSVAAGDTATVNATGFNGEVVWEVSDGDIAPDGDSALFMPPDRLGDYSVVARWGETSAATTVSVDQATVYHSDFSAEPGAEWTNPLTTTSPSGEPFLGEFGAERTQLWLQGLPTHDEVTIEFDLYILRSWDGLAGRDRWELQLNDEWLINTTFSNDEKRQAWPANFPYGDHPGQSGAVATNSLGYWFGDESNPADSTYHIKRTFGHEGPILWFEFFGHELQDITDESWGIDNLTVTIQRTPRGVERSATEVAIEVQPGRVTVTGLVPDPTIEAIVRDAVEDWYDGSTLSVDFAPVSNSITPTWLPRLADVMYELRGARSVTWSATDNVVVLTGSLSTDRYRQALTEQLIRRLGPTVSVVDQTADSVAGDVIDEVESSVVLFGTGSSELDETAMGVLDRVVALLAESPEMAIHVVGHTDLTGTEQQNSDLSWERASNAIAYMVGRGVSADRLRTHGDGPSNPAVEGTSTAASDANRRVVFWVFDR